MHAVCASASRDPSHHLGGTPAIPASVSPPAKGQALPTLRRHRGDFLRSRCRVMRQGWILCQLLSLFMARDGASFLISLAEDQNSSILR